MFWKKKDNNPQTKKPTEQEVLKSQRELLKKQIMEETETLTKGQAIIYQLSEFYSFARFIGIEPNPTFPQKGKKYRMFTDEMVDGKPAGKKSYVDSTNNASVYADWVADKDSDKYGHVKRFQ
jgi:hypothetical protein